MAGGARVVDLMVWNTMGRELQKFEPITAGTVGMYCCGPSPARL